jgi:5-methylcytosine-specific restriction endonuclease McrA
MIRYPLYKELDKNGKAKLPFVLYQEAVNRTTNNKRIILQGFEKEMQKNYDEYQKQFDLQNVHNITKHNLTQDVATNLKSLYTSNSAVAKNIRNYFDNELANRLYRNTCPYCTLSGADTIEHIIPKEDFPEYAIHVYNLIPCCGKCNSTKGDKIKDNSNNPEFINFYYHDIETDEFLQADLQFDNNGFPCFSFSLNFGKNFNSILRKTIENHFTNLHLLDRYKKASVAKYAECELTIMPYVKQKSNLIKALSDFCIKITSSYGKNHYYSAMLRAMATSIQYHTYLSNMII